MLTRKGHTTLNQAIEEIVELLLKGSYCKKFAHITKESFLLGVAYEAGFISEICHMRVATVFLEEKSHYIKSGERGGLVNQAV